MNPARLLLCLGLLAVSARAASIVNSAHNLSASSPGTIKAVTESELCIFCHTPHNSVSDAPLWNRFSSGQTYTPYTSTTSKAVPGQPTGDSKLCLSCHDGTIALGMVRSRAQITMSGGVTVLPAGRAATLGTDLADDHPISFTYDAALVAANGQLQSPATLTGPVRLDASGQLQCTACHNAHDNQFGKFLVMNNTASALCLNCHNKTYWSASSHKTATKTWNGLGTNPWPHTSYTTVQANACENCHRPHTAGNKPRLLNFAGEEPNCYTCHSGNVAAKNIQAEFSKASVHPIANTTGVHDPTEDPVNPPRHVECADCHNPHAAKSLAATAPTATGALAGVKGIDAAGTVVNPLVNEYELCFRCHADSTNRGPARITRQFVQTNTRLDFQATNASYHPVVATGKYPTIPGLIAPWTATSRMYCTDCHNNNQGPGAGGVGPKGPHGSTFPPLLERRYDFTDNVTESAALYALCYKCHDRTTLFGGGFRHQSHLTAGGSVTPCSTCHDPHGVASQKFLINFNTSIVLPSPRGGAVNWTSTGVQRGSCTLSCHGTDHSPKGY